MLIPCPECERKVSDRAAACPECGFPIREWLAEREQAERREHARQTRARVGEADCPSCDARGFVIFSEADDKGVERPGFTWCVDCKHTGRVPQCRDSEGHWAVSHALIDGFLAGTIDPPRDGLHFLGSVPASEHRYTRVGDEDPSDAEPAK
jgi:hypothetical protein